MTLCQRCDQPLRGPLQHESREQCFGAMKATLAEVRFAVLSVERGIAECQMAKHFPEEAAGKSDFCRRDFFKAMSGVQVIAKIVGGEMNDFDERGEALERQRVRLERIGWALFFCGGVMVGVFLKTFFF